MSLPSSTELQALIGALKPVCDRANELASQERQNNPGNFYNSGLYHEYANAAIGTRQAIDALEDVLKRALHSESVSRGN